MEPTLVKDLGSAREVSALQFLKALEPTVVSVSGSLIEVRCLQSQNAFEFIFLTPCGTMTLCISALSPRMPITSSSSIFKTEQKRFELCVSIARSARIGQTVQYVRSQNEVHGIVLLQFV